MASTEVHTYAFSVAANVILSLFPFIVLLLTLAQKLFHSATMVTVIGDMLRTILPNNQDFIVRNMTALVHPHSGTKIFSVVMLLHHLHRRLPAAGGRAQQCLGRQGEPQLP